MKYFARKPDSDYWTDLWESLGEPSYARALRGRLTRELRATFQRYAPPGARVLEAGCGRGHFTVAADALGYRAEGLDWSEPTIARMRRRFPGIGWHVGDVRALEFDDGEFDAVYSPGVCEHFEEGPEQILAETRRILRPGGVAVISTPHLNDWLAARPHLFAAPGDVTGDFHQYGFSAGGMTTVLRRIGFEVAAVYPYGALGTLAEFRGVRLPAHLARGAAALLERVPPIRERLGYSCIWIARRP